MESKIWKLNNKDQHYVSPEALRKDMLLTHIKYPIISQYSRGTLPTKKHYGRACQRCETRTLSTDGRLSHIALNVRVNKT